MTQVHIPIVDIAPFREGNPEGSRHAVERIGHACEEIGFFGMCTIPKKPPTPNSA